jgi:serine protease AprX
MDARKLHPALAMAMVDEGDEPVPVIVRLRHGVQVDSTEVDDVMALAVTAGAQPVYRYSLVPAVAFTTRPDQIRQLTESPNVDTIWPDLPVYTMLNDSVPIVRAPRVWESGFTGQDVTVAVVDTGIDVDHPDFEGRIAAVTDFTGEGADDNNGHGTHVASTAAGSGAASDGTYRGVAPDATIVAAKVLRGNGSGQQSDVMAGIEWAVDQGASVINLSLGGPPTPCDGTDALSTLVDAAVEAGAIMAVAAGNSGPGALTVGSPGCARKAITVGASVSDPANDYDMVADFSSRGPTADGRRKPDLVLPGVGIIAARADGTALGQVVNEYYTTLQGTSMATPHAAGMVALLLSANPDLEPDEIKRQLMTGARSLHLEGNIQGAGRGDAYNAFLGTAGQPLPPRPSSEPSGCLASVMNVLRR